MCLIFLSFNHHKKYRLIVAANRDEFYKRQTAPAHFWDDFPHILGGRDLEAGGTWMGITRQGKIAMVTNYRDLRNLKPVAPSRGLLVADYLVNGNQPLAFVQQVNNRAADYNGFNLIAGYTHQLVYYSNYRPGPQVLHPGIYGLSNHLLNTPWPKVERGKKIFEEILSTSFNHTDLLEFLRNEERAPDDQLPDTGIGLERERALSSMFIRTPDYGSRCSTIITVDYEDRVVFTERTYRVPSVNFLDTSYEFTIRGN